MIKLFHDVSQQCSKAVTEKYSTSFSSAIKLLHPDLRTPIYNIYGFVRFADEIVDIFGLIGALPVLQANQLVQVVREVVFIDNGWLAADGTHFAFNLTVGVVLTLTAGVVIFGGLHRIATHATRHSPLATPHIFTGKGLPSQGDFTVTGEAFVTDEPITLLGFVNRETGVIEEPGHPADGQSMAGKIAIFPKGSGSSVAPYVLLELYYRGVAPLAIINTAIDQQTAPACSLEGIPYAYGFDGDVVAGIPHAAQVELKGMGDTVTIRVS
jgi:predicted aconitase with swiveling domain